MSTALSKSFSPPRLGLESAGAILSPEEFDAITQFDENFNYELIHGVLVVSPIPSPAETDPNEELGYLLRDYQKHHPQGRCIDKTLVEQYIYTGDSRRRANRVIWVGLGRTPDRRRDVPTIVVEFVSRSKRDFRRDHVEKRQEYLALGVVEYWVINCFERTLTVYCTEEPSETIIKEFEAYSTARLPGFELRLEEILAVADDWEHEGQD